MPAMPALNIENYFSIKERKKNFALPNTLHSMLHLRNLDWNLFLNNLVDRQNSMSVKEFVLSDFITADPIASKHLKCFYKNVSYPHLSDESHVTNDIKFS